MSKSNNQVTGLLHCKWALLINISNDVVVIKSTKRRVSGGVPRGLYLLVRLVRDLILIG